jgi:protocatechuate 3,4-dioxygenase beta subunit
LAKSIKESLENRAGTGVVVLKEDNGILLAKRDIILGVNIPDYD